MRVGSAASIAAVGLFLSSMIYPIAAPAQPSCLDVITCACEDATGRCQTFPSSCVPAGWTIIGYFDCGVAADPMVDCLDVITYARNPDTGECVEFPSSCTPPGWAPCGPV